MKNRIKHCGQWALSIVPKFIMRSIAFNHGLLCTNKMPLIELNIGIKQYPPTMVQMIFKTFSAIESNVTPLVWIQTHDLPLPKRTVYHLSYRDRLSESGCGSNSVVGKKSKFSAYQHYTHNDTLFIFYCCHDKMVLVGFLSIELSLNILVHVA